MECYAHPTAASVGVCKACGKAVCRACARDLGFAVACPAVERDPDRVSGAWVFRGTRVPVSALFENLEDGAVALQFVDWFPGVTLEQVRAVLDHAARSALATA